MGGKINEKQVGIQVNNKKIKRLRRLKNLKKLMKLMGEMSNVYRPFKQEGWGES